VSSPAVLPAECDRILVTADEIAAKVAELGAEIQARHAGHDLRLITVLRGGLFFLADLSRAIDAPLKIDFLAVAPYAPGGGTSVRMTKDLDDDIAGARIVLVEDVVDTGLTVNYVLSFLASHEPESIEVCALFDKPVRRIAEVPVASRGFEMGDSFLVGYGLDLQGRYRNLPYVASWKWDLIDAMYMTVITVGTVGYGETNPLTDAGRVFTMLIIASGVAAAGYAGTKVLQILIESQFPSMWEGRRMHKRIESLTGHTVLAGVGRVGRAVATTLQSEGADFVIVDQSDEGVELARSEGWLYVQGDATDEDVLMSAGIVSASALVTALDTDAENLFVTVTARDLNPDIFIVARSAHETSEQKMLRAGANRILTPNVTAGRRMATMVLHPTVSDYLDLVSHAPQFDYRLQEVVLGTGSKYHGATIAESRVRELTGAYILAVRHRDDRIDTNPAPETVLHEGDRLVVLGTAAQVDALTADA